MQEKKRLAGWRAAEYVQSDMVVGLGSGSTARYATLRLAERIRAGELTGIVGIPTSKDTAALARQEGIALGNLNGHPRVDITIDGADEVAPNLDLIKGLGGALLREKIVASASALHVIVVDDSKLVDLLGTRAPLPVEIVRFGYESTIAKIAQTGCRVALRIQNGVPFVTDEGHYLVDCRYAEGITAPEELGATLCAIPGVVEHGMFLGMASRVIVAGHQGLSVLER